MNLRSVAAATALPKLDFLEEASEFIATAAGLEKSLSADRIDASDERLTVNKSPGNAVFGGSVQAIVMLSEAHIEVFAGAGVERPVTSLCST